VLDVRVSLINDALAVLKRIRACLGTDIALGTRAALALKPARRLARSSVVEAEGACVRVLVGGQVTLAAGLFEGLGAAEMGALVWEIYRWGIGTHLLAGTFILTTRVLPPRLQQLFSWMPKQQTAGPVLQLLVVGRQTSAARVVPKVAERTARTVKSCIVKRMLDGLVVELGRLVDAA
jgi:hypothetical protein